MKLQAEPRNSGVLIAREPHAHDLPLPEYATEGAAGMDLRAAVPLEQPLRIDAGGWALVPTGIRIALPQGCEAQIRPRSGLALRNGIGILNSPGTIDQDYRGEIGHGARRRGIWAYRNGVRITEPAERPRYRAAARVARLAVRGYETSSDGAMMAAFRPLRSLPRISGMRQATGGAEVE
jgi:dUTP pyrophosphatase